MANFFEVSAGTDRAISGCGILAHKMGYQEVEQNLRDQLLSFRQRELTVVVAGEARRGKSSLLNALLNQQTPLFPVDINVCTNVVTVVRYGNTEQIQAYLEDPKAPEGYRVEQLPRERIAEYVSESGNPNNYKRVKKLEARIPCDLLKGGVVFVDTPGVGSLNVEHAETTFSYLPYADILLFVATANAPMTETELKFLKRGYGYCDCVLYPLTMMDLNPEYDVILRDNQQKIADTLGLKREDVQLVPVSSAAKLRYLKNGRSMLLKNSNFPALENAIWSTVTQRRGQILLLPYLQAAEDELRKMADSVSAQYQVLGDDDAAEELELALCKQIGQLELLQDGGAEWHNELAVFFPTLQNEITMERTELSSRTDDLIMKWMDEQGLDICKKEKYSALLGEVNDVITQGVLDIQQTISGELDQKMAELYESMSYGVDINQTVLEKIHFEATDTLKIQFPEKKVFNSIVQKGRNITGTSMGCGAAGSVVGAVVGGIVGIFTGGPVGMLAMAKAGAVFGGGAGSMIGSAKGVIDSLEQYDNMDAAMVRKTMSKYAANSIARAYNVINTVLTQLRVEVTASFEQQLKRQVREIQDNIAQFRSSLSVQKNEIPRKQADLNARAEALKHQLEVLQKLEVLVAQLHYTPVRQKEPAPAAARPAPVEKPSPRTAPGIYDFL